MYNYKYSTKLARMKKFYTEYKDLSILPMPLAKLPWSFNSLLIDKIKNKGDGVKYCNNSATLEQCPLYDNNKTLFLLF